MEYQILQKPEDLETAISKNDALLLYFSSANCNVCKVLKPKLAEKFRNKFPKLQLFYIDIEKSPILSGQFRIFTIPTILVYFEQKEFIRKSRNIGVEELSNEISRPYSLFFEE
jgi:hypothetical protein